MKDYITVQLLVSGDGSGEDKITLGHVYAACVSPYALGIPAFRVQLYCSNAFRSGLSVSLIAERLSGVVKIPGFNPPHDPTLDLFPDSATEDAPFFQYFMHIFNRSLCLQEGTRLPKCAIRFICGHGVTTGGNNAPGVACGASVPFNELVEENASLLTVLDCCLSPSALHALKPGAGYQAPSPPESAFTDVNFPMVC